MQATTNKPKIIAITGGICSGKTIVANILSQYNFFNIDADIIAHQITTNNGMANPEIKDKMGAEYIDKNGNLRRDFVKQKIFSNTQESKRLKEQLENIIHPIVHKQILEQIQNLTNSFEYHSKHILLTHPLLYEKYDLYRNILDEIIVISIKPKLQLKRLMQRDDINEKLAQNLINTQATQKQREKIATRIIENNSNKRVLKKKVKRLLLQIKQ